MKYAVSGSQMKQIDQDIVWLTGVTEDTTAMKTTFEGDGE